MISITDSAVEKLKELIGDQAADGAVGLRLGVEKGGCAGMQYTMQVEAAKPGDEIVECGGVRVLIGEDSLPLLQGCTVDYHDDLNDAGFKILNPNASRSCGCGTSFEPAEENAH